MIGTYVLTTNVTQVTGLDVQQLTCFHTADRACMLLSGILFGVEVLHLYYGTKIHTK